MEEMGTWEALTYARSNQGMKICLDGWPADTYIFWDKSSRWCDQNNCLVDHLVIEYTGKLGFIWRKWEPPEPVLGPVVKPKPGLEVQVMETGVNTFDLAQDINKLLIEEVAKGWKPINVISQDQGTVNQYQKYLFIYTRELKE